MSSLTSAILWPFAPRLRRGVGGWLAGSFVVAALVAAPIVSLALLAAQGSGDLWPHLVAYILPQAFRDTLLLLGGVGILVVTIGASAAWLVTAYDFPGRRWLEWALLLPLAMPTYIIAYAYLDLLHPIGPVQSGLRALLGYESPRDLILPDIRSMGGCILLFGFVLYPYVYLSTRAMFLMQIASLVEVARTLSAGRAGVFFRVALPLARPAIAVGTSLALMEALNDVGASEFLGVRTLTVSIYSTWINRSNLPGAAQIALLMLLVVVTLIIIERFARRRQRYAGAAQRQRKLTPQRLGGWRGALAVVACLVPVLIGFVLPALYLVTEAAKRIRFAGISPEIVTQTITTVTISAIATVVALLLGLVLAFTARLAQRAFSAMLLRVASLGYAVPGTVLALGLLAPLTAVDGWIDDTSRMVFGVGTGLLLFGSGAALVYAYAARFLTISTGGIEAGLARISPSLDHAGRTLGASALGVVTRIQLPLISPALLSAGLLVFVDCMKELPATLLLRPLNLETLATHLYGEAARGTYEDGSVAALAIVLFGLVPVVLLARLGQRRIVARGRTAEPVDNVASDSLILGSAALDAAPVPASGPQVNGSYVSGTDPRT
ncbi:MAG: iron transporter permease [Hyphomicrobiales bacterium]|nr:iron transporter permease [Hyphomicrobiales bacterium]